MHLYLTYVRMFILVILVTIVSFPMLCGCDCARNRVSGDASAEGDTETDDEGLDHVESDTGPDCEFDLDESSSDGIDCGQPEEWDSRVYIPSGCFFMGSPLDPSWSVCDELDTEGTSEAYVRFIEEGCGEHLVFLHGYWIDRYEVSIGEYYEYAQEVEGAWIPPRVCENIHPCLTHTACDCGGHPVESLTGWGDDGRPLPVDFVPDAHMNFSQLPMNCLNRQEAEAFCEWRGGRLPTEAEWERATKLRAPDRRQFATGYPFICHRDYCKICRDCMTYGWELSERQALFQSLPYVEVTNSGDVLVEYWDLSPNCILNMGCNISEWVGGDFEPHPGTYDEDKWIWSSSDCRVRGGSKCIHFDPPVWFRCLPSVISVDSRSSCVGFRCAYD